MNIHNFTRPNILSLSAYQAKEIPCKYKLDANESPFGFPVAKEIIQSIQTNRYPDPEAQALKKAVAKDLKIRPTNILQGNGSDELIYYLITTFGGPVLYPVPTFSMYGIIAHALGEKGIPVPLDGAFDLDLKKILVGIRKNKPKLIFLSSPNNPTGNCFAADRILKIIESVSGTAIVVVDEAYQPFASHRGFIPMLRDYDHLVIMRTLSKIGLAGLRVGFLIAAEEIIHEVNKVRLPFNLNALSQAIALKVMDSKAALKQNIQLIVSEREKLFRELSGIKGIKSYPSEANFILFRVGEPEKVYQGLLKKGILVRNMKGLVDGCLRVTVGTPEENRMFIKSLRSVLKN
jgi:histidinol-phosphate aminotransferase